MYKALLIIFPLLALAQEVYGPPISLNQLAPAKPSLDRNQQIDSYKGIDWYSKVGVGIQAEPDFEWSVKPNSEYMQRLKKGAVDGGLKINQELKRINPSELEGELIIRY
ncbi:MAG: hypothetical protein CME71_04050 [Halobacteriovorax sp.]|nr:hypothetical protein [Halobacteriovorax sp.]